MNREELEKKAKELKLDFDDETSDEDLQKMIEDAEDGKNKDPEYLQKELDKVIKQRQKEKTEKKNLKGKLADADKKIKSPGDIQQSTQDSFGKSNLIQEPVPQYSKQPHEMVIQGSNNTLITMGVDGQETEAGTIDIVVGRGAPNIVTSQRPFSDGLDVPDKTVIDEAEGQRDFGADKARIYVSMKKDSDANFGLDGFEPVSSQESSVIAKADIGLGNYR